MKPDLYSVLGVARGATPAKIKAAFKQLAKTLHPDAGGKDKDFARLSAAYMVLRDKKRREKYDETGSLSESEVDSDLKRMASMMFQLFNKAVTEGLADRSDVDVIKLMLEHIKKCKGERDKSLAASMKEAKAVKKLGERISRKNKGRNLFAPLVKDRLRALDFASATIRQELRMINMLVEELENYSCLVEIVRVVEMYYFGEVATSTASSTF